MIIQDLGLMDYEEAYRKQKQALEEIIKEGDEVLFLCEHPAVLTLGRLAKSHHILSPSSELNDKRIKVLHVDRGGEVTLHAPGQLVAYPILNLKRRGKDLNLYIRTLERIIIDFLDQWALGAVAVPGKTGVWVGNKKIASIGIGVKKWISFHGLALNINTDLDLFNLIRPCGLDVRMTSVKDLMKEPVEMTAAKEGFVRIFQKHFERSGAEDSCRVFV